MSQAKIELKVGRLQFSGEAEQDWLERQLDKLLECAKASGSEESGDPADEPVPDAQSNGGLGPHAQPLAAYLKSRNAIDNQNRTFLATAFWLSNKSKDDPTTGDVVKALANSKQKKLGNASQSLNNNVTKGFCEKRTDKRHFFVTEHGKRELGE